MQEFNVEKKKFRITLTSEMLGTVPKDPEVYKAFIESKKPAALNSDDEAASVQKVEEKGWTGFHADKGGLFIFNYMIRGFLKAAGDAMSGGITVEKPGKKGTEPTSDKLRAIKSKIDKYVFVYPRRIYLERIKEDGVIERPLRAMTQQGPRVTLARSDYVVEGCHFDIEIHLMPQREVTWGMIKLFFQYGRYCGLGQFRNGGYGSFTVEEIGDKEQVNLAKQ